MAISRRRLLSKTVLLGGLGTLIVLLTAVILIRSDLLLAVPQAQSILQEVAEMDHNRLVVSVALLLLLYAIWSGRQTTIRETKTESAEPDEDLFSTAQERPPEKVTASRRPVTNESVETTIKHAINGDHQALQRVRSNLESVAVKALMHRDGLDSNAAVAAVERGTWTDSHIAAAFLASNSHEPFSLLDRLRLWLDPVTERRRRITRTIEEIRSTYRWGPSK